MIIRRTRLAVFFLLALILGLALWSVLHFGPEHFLRGSQRRGGAAAPPVSVGKAALLFSANALFWTAVFDAAWRRRRWRRNLLSAGSVFATAWITSLLLILTIQVTMMAGGLGYRIDRGAAITAVLGLILIFRANLLPKTRPAWFNGVALPIFASRPDVWRRVHRGSAFRLLGIGLFALLLAIIPASDVDRPKIIILLLVAELLLASGHALWLGAQAQARHEAG